MPGNFTSVRFDAMSDLAAPLIARSEAHPFRPLAAYCLDSEKSAGVFGRCDTTELDNSANLLCRLGRKTEALARQRQAVAVSEGRDPEIAEHLKEIMSEAPTWPVG
jgi:hypothetical protein